MEDEAPLDARPLPLPVRRRRQVGDGSEQQIRRDEPVRGAEQRRGSGLARFAICNLRFAIADAALEQGVGVILQSQIGNRKLQIAYA